MDYVNAEQAREMPGLRLVLHSGLPAPWSESAKGIMKAKGISYVPVVRGVFGDQSVLEQWTGHKNAPVAMWENEPARAGWAEILMLAERVKPEPALVPADMDTRVQVMGLSHLICGEQGFGWNRRQLMTRDLIAKGDAATDAERGIVRLITKYGYTEEEAAVAPERVAAILRHLAHRLHEQEARGSSYFVGNNLTAVDIYWACFAVLLDPPPAEVNPMPGMMRALYTNTDPVVAEATDPILLKHRDFIYERYLGLPLDF